MNTDVYFGRLGTEPAQQRQTVHARHTHVRQDQIRHAVGPQHAAETLTSVHSRVDLKTVVDQRLCQRLPNGFVVIHNQDAERHARILSQRTLHLLFGFERSPDFPRLQRSSASFRTVGATGRARAGLVLVVRRLRQGAGRTAGLSQHIGESALPSFLRHPPFEVRRRRGQLPRPRLGAVQQRMRPFALSHPLSRLREHRLRMTDQDDVRLAFGCQLAEPCSWCPR